jgi:hypothetical protein
MRLTHKLATVAAAAASTVLLAGPASAAVNFDPATGTGFVGKGDVQLAFGWNNPQLQTNASGVTFSYSATDTYEAVCTWTTLQGPKGTKTHNVDHKRTAGLNSVVAYDARVRSQITGFKLNGFGATVESGEVPVENGPCVGSEGHDGTWTAVTLIDSTSDLSVNYGGIAVPLQYT